MHNWKTYCADNNEEKVDEIYHSLADELDQRPTARSLDRKCDRIRSWLTSKCTNTTTTDMIDISIHSRNKPLDVYFYTAPTTNKIFCFTGKELHDWIFENRKNPYTREDIPVGDLSRMRMEYNRVHEIEEEPEDYNEIGNFENGISVVYNPSVSNEEKNIKISEISTHVGAITPESFNDEGQRALDIIGKALTFVSRSVNPPEDALRALETLFDRSLRFFGRSNLVEYYREMRQNNPREYRSTIGGQAYEIMREWLGTNI